MYYLKNELIKYYKSKAVSLSRNIKYFEVHLKLNFNEIKFIPINR